MERTILHIDFDSFFASVEQQYNPLLRERPIGVTATNGRTCIIASSREAKRFGVKTGTRSWEAKKMCPSIVLVGANFVKYLEVSKLFLSICKDYSPFVELFSIDELFMDVTKTSHLFGGVFPTIKIIKDRIRKEIGEYITASFGVSYNKLLAKLASGLQKPNGLVVINKEDVDGVYKKAKLTDICGIGERLQLRLKTMGIYTLPSLRNVPLSSLMAEFGPVQAQALWDIGHAIDDSPVIPYTIAEPVKSVGRNYCLPQNEYDKRVVFQNIYELCEEISIKLRRLSKKARTVGIFLRGSTSMGGRKTFAAYLDCGSELFEACRILIDRDCMLQKEGYVRQIGVWVGNLEDKYAVPVSLFSTRKESLIAAIDAINERFGHHTIRNGFLLYADKLTTVPNGYMADRYERTKLANEAL